MTSFINDQGREIQISEDILITRQVASIKNFKIKGDLSVSFTVPNNSENRKTLGYYGSNQINSPIFSDTSFNLVRNGNILMRGLMVIEEDTGDELSLYFISGNSNWFNLFQFNCRDIRTTRYQTYWSPEALTERVGATEGIVFPVIDWLYKGEKADKYIDAYIYSGLKDSEFLMYEYFPCLYVHTLVDEIANHSGIKITGDLLSDKFYKTLIVTPDAPDIYDPETQALIRATRIPGPASLVNVQSISPNMKAIEFIKWLCVSFGVIPVFDAFDQTLTLDLTNKKTGGEDWSPYLQSYKIKYDQVQNNIISLEDAPEDKFNSYNETRDIKYGWLNIESDKNDGQSTELYTSPFLPCFDAQSSSMKLAVPFVPMYELEDEDGFEFTAVNNISISGLDSHLQFVGIGFPFDNESQSPVIIKVKGSSDIYDGYRRAWSYTALGSDYFNSNTEIRAYGTYSATTTGTIYTQSVSKGNPGSRILSFIPSIASADFNSVTIKSGDPKTNTSLTNASTAYYHKPFYSLYPNLMKYRQGLSYGAIEDKSDYPLSETYFRYIKNIFKGPTITTYMLLPELVFQRFNFGLVYLNTGDLNGYYFVDSIVNYKDAVTPVEVNLLSIVYDENVSVVSTPSSTYTITSDPGSYTYSGTDVTLTPLKLDISIDLFTSYGSTFKATYVSTESKELSRTNTGTTSGQILFKGSVDCMVTKATNASGPTSIVWYKNMNSQNSVSLNAGDPVNETYTFTSVTSTDDLMVEIYEG